MTDDTAISTKRRRLDHDVAVVAITVNSITQLNSQILSLNSDNKYLQSLYRRQHDRIQQLMSRIVTLKGALEFKYLQQLESENIDLNKRYNDAMSQLKDANSTIAKLTDGSRDRNTTSVHRFILTYIEGEARGYFVSVYDNVIASVETNSTERRHTLPCREWSEHGINQFNATHSSGRFVMRKGRLVYTHNVTLEVQDQYKVEFENVLNKRHEAMMEFCGTTHIKRISRIATFTIIIARVYIEREFLNRAERSIEYLQGREASHLCHFGPCISDAHIFFEPRRVNFDRNACGGPPICAHIPQCLYRGCYFKPPL